MSVWLTIPSARPPAEANAVLEKWRAHGYRIALWRDDDSEPPICDLLLAGEYPGYARAVNALIKEVLRLDADCRWFVTGGDDTEPDPNYDAWEIGMQCSQHFGGEFGVMQPTGDRWADGSIDRICGSPWMGREFCKRMYGGKGPLYEEFLHCFEDEELQEVAKLLGVLWQRRDLTHLHRHYLREGEGANVRHAQPPPHLMKWTTQEHWSESQALFNSRKRAGFPGYEPLPARATFAA